ncbi:MAG TPA: ATP-binding protein, partial [Ignavibacteriaceae bacterium]|nr:ATP-binding protein [Ignavibacteriaceae bacterium]
YVSLLDYLKDDEKDFSYTWTTIVLNDEIYYQTMRGIFRFTKDKSNSSSGSKIKWKLKSWKPKAQFNFAFNVNNTYYVQQGGVGLMKMVKDSLILLPGGEQFADDRLQVMLPYNFEGKKEILVGTFNKGLFLFDGSSFKPFDCEANPYLKQYTLYRGSVLSNDTYVLTTLNGGMVVIDKLGNIKLLLNKKFGLSSNSVTALFIDSKGLIWIAPEGSVSTVEYPSPITIFNESSGSVTSILTIARHNGILYFGGTSGVYYLDKETSTIQELNGFLPGNTQTFHLLPYGDQLLVSHGTGFYSIKGLKVKLIKKTLGQSFVPQFIHISQKDSNRIFIALIDGIASFYRNKNKNSPEGRQEWLNEGKIIGLDSYIISIAEVKPGVLLAASDSRGIFRLDFNDRPINNPKMTEFGVKQGFTPGGALTFPTNKEFYVVFSDGVYTYNDDGQKFAKDTLLSWDGLIDFSSVVIKNDFNNNLWITTGKEVTFYRLQENGSYRPEKTFTSRLSRDPIGSIYPEENGIVWFGGSKSVYRFDEKAAKNDMEEFRTLVRRVVIGEDSLIFGGYSETGSKTVPEIDYSNNSILFEFSAISMIDPSASEYQSKLEGFDEKWSAWKKDNHRNYTNLPSGDYTFRVKGKNLYQVESREASFSFTIRPPWYSNFWAYAGYAVVLASGFFSIDRMQRRRLTRKEREKAKFRESELRAETAEAEAKALQAENDRRKNVELLSEIGKEITASLELDTIFYKLYEHVNQLADATIFGVGIYHPEREEIEYRLALEKGKRYPPYSRDTKDKNQFPVWCVENKEPIFINDVSSEYRKYIQYYKEPERVLEDGSFSREPRSLIYIPLISKERVLGVITIQSFIKNAYTDYHFKILQNLASYTAIALDNADAYHQLNETIYKLDSALNDLKSTQEKLVVQEKLASLGQLTAGIAHEIKNPLNFVNNFAQLAKELVEELREEYNKVKDKFASDSAENFEDLLSNIEQNVTKTNEHGKRADSIVRSMLQHSRGKSGERILSDINAVLEEDLNLAFHGLRARDASFNITIEKDFDRSIEKISIVPQDVSRVFLNVINNGFYEANKKKKTGVNNFAPALCVRTINKTDAVEVRIKDNGNGVPPEARDKLFNPFFTTKPAGEGTGLGLSLSYDIIVKEHSGSIRFETEQGAYTEFIISLPKNGK